MKNFSITIIGLCCVALFSVSCDSLTTQDKKVTTANDSVSYYIGLNVGYSLQNQFASDPSMSDIDFELLVQGVKNVLVDDDAEATNEEVMAYIQSYFMSKQAKEGEARIEEGKKWLADNKDKHGVFETETGLQYKIVKEGNGAQPTAESTVKCHYEGRLTDGTIFDSSYERGQPTDFPLNGVIRGWTEGIQLMAEGAEYEFYIPAELAYGANPPSREIPPHSVLIFKVELIEVVN